MVPGATAKNFIYKKPGPLAHLLSIVIHLAPKVGPLRAFSFEIPGRYEEEIFIKSFDSVNTNFKNTSAELSRGTFIALNMNMDTGDETKRGDYSICDKTYDELLERLDKKGFRTGNEPLRKNILEFYGGSENERVERLR